MCTDCFKRFGDRSTAMQFWRKDKCDGCQRSHVNTVLILCLIRPFFFGVFFLNAGYSVYSALCFIYIVSYKVHFMKLDTTIYVFWQVFLPILSNWHSNKAAKVIGRMDLFFTQNRKCSWCQVDENIPHVLQTSTKCFGCLNTTNIFSIRDCLH